jgi:hypothetical protein
MSCACLVSRFLLSLGNFIFNHANKAKNHNEKTTEAKKQTEELFEVMGKFVPVLCRLCGGMES